MRRAQLVGALVALVALAGGCGDSDEPAPQAAALATTPTVVDVDPVGTDRAGSVAQLADCGDWNSGTREQRLATIADIRGQHTPQGSSTAASPLPDERAYEIFEEACEPEWADSLRLYKLYVRVQSFAPLSE